MAFLYRPKRTKTDPKTGKKTPYKSAKWYVRYTDPQTGKRVTAVGYTDRAASLQLATRLEREAAQRAEGLLTDARDHARRELSHHLIDFEAHLLAKGDRPRGVAVVITQVKAIAAGCGWEWLRDLAPGPIEKWLAEQRADPKRRFSDGTSDSYLACVRHFGRWLTDEGRLGSNPFLKLKPLHTPPARLRRSLDRAEFATLIQATRAGKRFRDYLDGPQRAALYLTAAYTGLRASELASLTPESFRLKADPPTWTIDPAAEKAGRGDELPLHPDLVDVLKGYLVDVDAGERLWPGAWASNFAGARMLRFDLDAAGIPYRTNDGVYDFHSLRVQFVSDLARAGVPLQVAQRLARHTDPRLTAKTYTRLGLSDLARDVGKLPRLAAG